ncbi:hypothetical protein ACJJIF_10665 [Microbulbifer sp. SSSA002]|uniref:hypothetical protein n=1 Tax=unclassified Microbulbifer TaxID=2619833 RepID=UPI00403A5360
MKNVLCKAVLSAAIISASATSFAATDSASSKISLEFTPVIEIESVEDVAIKNQELGADLRGIENFCVAGMGFSTYSVTFESNDGNNDDKFTLHDGQGVEVPYSVGFDNSLLGSFTGAEEGTPLTGNTRNAITCADNHDNARFEINIANVDWENQAVTNGTHYTDTLLITVASE